jgi:hypothetical protein
MCDPYPVKDLSGLSLGSPNYCPNDRRAKGVFSILSFIGSFRLPAVIILELYFSE